MLFGALVVVVAGSLLGEILGINQLLGKPLVLVRAPGLGIPGPGPRLADLAGVGLLCGSSCCTGLWPLPSRTPSAGRSRPCSMLAALAIPVFYLPAFFFSSATNYTVVDNWRFWIIHLWVEGFFELLVTAMVAVTFF